MAPASKSNNLVELFEDAVRRHGDRPLFGTKTGGQWAWSSYREVGEQVDQCRAGLAALGVQPGHRVAIVSNNRIEWAVTAFGCYGLGATVVPLYEAQPPDELEFIIRDCEARVVVASTPSCFEQCRERLRELPEVQHVIGMERAKHEPDSFRGLLERGASSPLASVVPRAGDTACFIYTAGTTGQPKGVKLSHGNITSNVAALQVALPLSSRDRSLSFLPWAHAFGFTCELHALSALGASMALCESVDKVLDNLGEVEPTLLISVPRLLNVVYASVQQGLRTKPAMIQRIFRLGTQAAARRRRGPLGLADRATLAAAERVILSRLRAKLGGRLEYVFSGAAALSREVAEFMDGLGITIYEGYGLTETSPVVSTNRPGARRLGSVGATIPGVRITLDQDVETSRPDEGEIIVHGPNVMQGYHHRDEDNELVFTPDDGHGRGVRTGDIGMLDDDGFLFITGRLKEQYKLQNGKYVVPAPLEDALRLSPFIASVMVHGDNREYNVALIVPDLDALNRWVSAEGLQFADTAEMLCSEAVLTRMLEEVDERSRDARTFERVRRIVLVEEDFTTQNGLLTPAARIRRQAVTDRYRDRLAALYEGPGR